MSWFLKYMIGGVAWDFHRINLNLPHYSFSRWIIQCTEMSPMKTIQSNDLSIWILAWGSIHFARNPWPWSLKSFQHKVVHLLFSLFSTNLAHFLEQNILSNLAVFQIIWAVWKTTQPLQHTSASTTTEEYGPGLLTIRETLADSISDKRMLNFATWWWWQWCLEW